MIPQQLKEKEYRFIKASKDKKGIETNWSITNNYSYDDNRLTEWLNQKGNYGVLGGYGNLLIIDFDTIEAYNKIKNLLPPTFTVLSANKRLPHLYYKCDQTPYWFKVMDKEQTLIDGQGKGKMVIGAGSINREGNKYEISNDVPIAQVYYSEINAIITKTFDNYRILSDSKNVINIKTQPLTFLDPSIDEIKSRMKISSYLRELGININHNPTICPLGHSSKGGHCFSFDDHKNGGVFHCFHCEESGDVLSLYMLINKVNFVTAKKELLEKLNIKPLIENIKKSLQLNIDSVHPVEIVKNLIIDNPVYYDRSCMWWLWNEKYKVWQLTDETDLLNIVLFDLDIKGIVTPMFKASIINALKMFGRRNQPLTPDNNWIQFGSKIINIKTLEEFESSSKYFFTNSLPYDFGLNDQTPVMDKIFTEWVGEDNKELLYEIIAYCCLRTYPINRIFVFLGRGSNGKSKYLELISKFIGERNVCSTELDVLLDNRFETAKLYKKLVCMMGETNFNEMKKTSILKKLSGGDLVGFEFKNKNPFDDRNYAKILISTNTLPTSHDKTLGFYRRWVIIDFDRQFNEVKDILNDIPEEEYNNLSNKVLKILSSLIVKRQFHNEGSIEERMRRYEEKSNPLIKFLELNVVKSYSGFIPKWEFRERFKTYLKSNGYREWTDNEIGSNMKEQYEDAQRGDNRLRVWLGVMWKDQVIEEEFVK
jgi:P4 family phage/plasmid primase-like protien